MTVSNDWDGVQSRKLIDQNQSFGLGPKPINTKTWKAKIGPIEIKETHLSATLLQGKTCLEKLKTLLKFLDGTTSLILRSSKRWSMAAAISVGIDETDELMTDEDTLAGKQVIILKYEYTIRGVKRS